MLSTKDNLKKQLQRFCCPLRRVLFSSTGHRSLMEISESLRTFELRLKCCVRIAELMLRNCSDERSEDYSDVDLGLWSCGSNYFLPVRVFFSFVLFLVFMLFGTRLLLIFCQIELTFAKKSSSFSKFIGSQNCSLMSK